MATSRIALITVHGVADQSPGETARSVAELLVHSAPDDVVYNAGPTAALHLRVDSLRPISGPAKSAGATPRSEDRPAFKAFLQSGRSDFHRSEWRARASATKTWKAWQVKNAKDARQALSDSPEGDQAADRGIAFSDFLLSKQQRNGPERDVYDTTCTTLSRSAAGQITEVDVYEMYWADLSRLSGALPRIVTELFTMVFRLSKLGRDTVDEARAAMREQRGSGAFSTLPGFAWATVSAMQTIIDWLFVNVLGLLFLQLALLGGVLLAYGALRELDPLLLTHVHPLGAAGVAIAGLSWLAYRFHDASVRSWRLPLALMAAGGAMLFVWPALSAWMTFALVLGAATWAGETGLRIADDRFPFVRQMGRVFWIVTVLVLLEAARRQFLASSGDAFLDLGPWVRATAFGVELILLATKLLWMVFGVAMAVWLIAGWFAACEAGFETKASVATGRLGLGLSMGAFLAMTMAIWALLNGVVGAAVDGIDYRPCVFEVAAKDVVARPLGVDSPAPPADAADCLWQLASLSEGGAMPLAASQFLDLRYRASTGAFGLVAALLLCLLVFLVAMFVPSVLAELKLMVARTRKGLAHAAFADDPADAGRARRLGRWLTSGYRSLDGVTHLVFGIGVALGVAVAIDYADLGWFDDLEPTVRELSQVLLKPLVISATGITASLVLFGGLLSKYLPGLRGPLDIAFDVDNHFREFPRASIPRARIFSRYAALLRHIAASGPYAKVVIVAHSQGTVISAELLRYLCSDGRHEPREGSTPQLTDLALPPLSLLTLGCPLRQLYASRFPTLYRWVIRRRGAISGPTADDVGVERWYNAYCSGDYVGRWLWSDHLDPPAAMRRGSPGSRWCWPWRAAADALGHPMVDGGNAMFGRSDAYACFVPMPPAAPTQASAREVEVCLGLGAHTHYFEREQTTVAWLIDDLVSR